MRWGDVKGRVEKMKELESYDMKNEDEVLAKAEAEAQNPPPEGTLQYRDFLVRQELALDILKRRSEKQQFAKPMKGMRVPD
jgi:hypothetical protein